MSTLLPFHIAFPDAHDVPQERQKSSASFFISLFNLVINTFRALMFGQAAAEALAWLISLTTTPEGRRCWNCYHILNKI